MVNEDRADGGRGSKRTAFRPFAPSPWRQLSTVPKSDVGRVLRPIPTRRASCRRGFRRAGSGSVRRLCGSRPSAGRVRTGGARIPSGANTGYSRPREARAAACRGEAGRANRAPGRTRGRRDLFPGLVVFLLAHGFSMIRDDFKMQLPHDLFRSHDKGVQNAHLHPASPS